MMRLNNLMLVFATLLLMAPAGPIPFSNTLPALALMSFAIGFIQRDGAAVAAGYAFVVATVVYFGVLLESSHARLHLPTAVEQARLYKGQIQSSRASSTLQGYLADTRHTTSPTSSATSSAPSASIAMPTGAPISVFSSLEVKPPTTVCGRPVGLPSLNGTRRRGTAPAAPARCRTATPAVPRASRWRSRARSPWPPGPAAAAARAHPRAGRSSCRASRRSHLPSPT
ncbi:hypothetical protein G6F35_012971 [Rhizopus arrhizus]|nr:hypothetical protein G6F35_012971 [Rhizopus arrhizus]